MPNGISCAYFAARNHLYGQKEQNIFKEGIAGAQTVRTVDTITRTGFVKGPVAAPMARFFGKAAAIARKIVYPLIVASGIYNTAKSDDKVRTGASQGLGIATMYTFEQAAEKGLNLLDKKLSNIAIVKNNKYARAGVYILKGLAFVGASLSGYNAGSKAGEIVIDKLRNIRQANEVSKLNKEISLPVDNSIPVGDIGENLFEDMML